jgi:hypothetical protein
VRGGSANDERDAKALGYSLMVGITSRHSPFLGRATANLAKFDRVVAASRLVQLYDVTAIKSSSHAGI